MRSGLLTPLLASGPALALVVSTAPALAHDAAHHGEQLAAWPDNNAARPRMDSYERQAWLDDCRSRVQEHDAAMGGAVVGGLVGGIAGNRLAGKRHRTAGTLAGAAVGGAAGAAIGKASRTNAHDACESYLLGYEEHYARYLTHYRPYYGSRDGHARFAQDACCPSMQGPALRSSQTAPNCTETVEYEDVPARWHIPRPAPRKRTKTVPDKRVPLE